MNASGNSLQPVQHASGSKPAAVEPAVQNEINLQNFIAPPPLAKPRSTVRSSYTSLVAMVSQSESLLPPPNIVTPSPVLDKVIADSEAVSDLCAVLNAGEGVLISNPDSPSIARSTFYGDRTLSADDVISAIECLWGVAQLPTIILDDQ